MRIEFVKEDLIFTGEDSPMANLMLSVMGAFAEFERALLRERQREGIALAKQRGAYRGRKRSLSPDQIGEVKRADRGRRAKGPGRAGHGHQPGNRLPVSALEQVRPPHRTRGWLTAMASAASVPIDGGE